MPLCFIVKVNGAATADLIFFLLLSLSRSPNVVLYVVWLAYLKPS